MTMISGIVVLASFPLIALIAAMVAHEPQLDIGLPMSMDAKKGVIFFFVISESLVLAAIGETAGVGTDFSIFSVLNRLGILNIALHVFFLALPGLVEILGMAGIALFMVIAIGSVLSLCRMLHRTVP